MYNLFYILVIKEKENMDTDPIPVPFDYTLIIEFDKATVTDLQAILQFLYKSSSFCHIDIEHLADEVIYRLNECKYCISDKNNTRLRQLISSTFNTLKQISIFMDFPSERIKIIHDDYNKFIKRESPTVTPVSSPKDEVVEVVDGVEKAKLPKLMKKLKKNGDRNSSPNKEEKSIKLPKIMKKVRDKA